MDTFCTSRVLHTVRLTHGDVEEENVIQKTGRKRKRIYTIAEDATCTWTLGFEPPYVSVGCAVLEARGKPRDSGPRATPHNSAGELSQVRTRRQPHVSGRWRLEARPEPADAKRVSTGFQKRSAPQPQPRCGGVTKPSMMYGGTVPSPTGT